MSLKPNQESFEACLKVKLEQNAFMKKLEAAANNYLKQLYPGSDTFIHPVVPREIVARSGASDEALGYVNYVLQPVVNSGTISSVYPASSATIDAWREVAAAIKAEVELKFGPELNVDFKAAFQKLTP